MTKFLLNSLSVVCPELTLDWHPTKNLPLTAETVTYGAQKRVWWLCHKCGHEWEAYINNRRKQNKYPGQHGTSCPNCIGRVQKLENSFAAANPNLIEQWHPTKNLPDTPYNVPISGPRKYWWVCNVCEQEWEASVGSRTGGSGCPYCGQFKNHNQTTNTKVWQKETRKLVLKSKYVRTESENK
jgi:hypothetical protein